MFGHDNYKQFATVREVEPRRVVIHVFGDVDLSSAGELIEAIDEAANLDGDSLLLINLSKCRYFDSSGLAALIHARKILGARLTVLVKSRSPIMRVMQIVGFDSLFNVVTELQTEATSRSYDVQLGLAARRHARTAFVPCSCSTPSVPA